jgi:hypothetical protein
VRNTAYQREEDGMATVAQAAAYLDATLGRGEWEPRIDLELLDQNDSRICVAGQLFPEEYGTVNVAYKRLGSELAAILDEDYRENRGPFGGTTTEEWTALLAERGFGRKLDPIVSVTSCAAIAFKSRDTQYTLDGDQLTITDYSGDYVTLDLAVIREMNA